MVVVRDAREQSACRCQATRGFVVGPMPTNAEMIVRPLEEPDVFAVVFDRVRAHNRVHAATTGAQVIRIMSSVAFTNAYCQFTTG
jgi:hypothetical protein